jgi:geranylgeranyl pyrophosphate synthase
VTTVTAETVDFAAERRSVNAALDRAASRYLDDVPPRIRDAIRYAIAGEGKRLRPILFLCAYRAAGGRRDATALAAAIEIVHTYSLVHDDLPCMDDDEVRRGRPTVHVAFDVPTATAAGLAMVPMAAHAAFDGARALALADAQVSAIVRRLMQASGASGMIGGQLLDLEGEGRALSLPELERVHSLKTGALIGASVVLGGHAASAPAKQLAALDAYGHAVGLAFQIADDVLDVTSTTDQLGKTAGRDATLRKSTFPGLLGIEGARAKALHLCEAACAALADAGLLTSELAYLARYAVVRKS